MFAGKDQRKLYIHLAILVAVLLIAEVFIGNLRYWRSLGYKEIIPDVAFEDDNRTVILSGFEGRVDNLYVEPFVGMDRDTIRTYVDIGYGSCSQERVLIIQGIEASKYIDIHCDGISLISITFDNDLDLYSWGDIKLNTTRPFNFEWIRFLVFLLIGAAVILVLDRRYLFRQTLDLNNRAQMAVVIAFGAVTAGFWVFIMMNSYYSTEFFNDMYVNRYVEGEYTWLVRSFLNGQTNMLFDPPAFMKELSDPYDINLINEAVKVNGEPVLMDYAYFNGHYYSYYGVVPAILFYLPWYMLTGVALQNNIVVIIASLVYIAGSFYLIRSISRKYFASVSFGRYMLISVLFINCSGFLYFVRNPNIYSVPFACSYVFMILGLAIWTDAVRREDTVKVSSPKLALGSLCIALTLGCRPTFYISMLFAFLIFAGEIREGLFFRKSSIKNTLMVIVPFVAVDLPLALYNYARFGNLLDFGASYNITVWNQHGNSFSFSRLLPGLYTYLIRPFVIRPEFPYIFAAEGIDDGSILYVESFIGGLFVTVPVTLVILALPFVAGKLKEHKMLLFAVTSLVMAAILLVIDIEFAGISIRYMSDFSIFIMLAFVTAAFALPGNRYLTAVLILLGTVSLVIGYLSMLTGGIWLEYESSKPMTYYFVKYVMLLMR
ncbi:hypothetical protein SAMN02910456_00292 [Ruminococcaceae bacterium YRB3002]|nr:hypothetical protein SAMN02910456_00292 [Ruminococcaceae bacterium YRB3002]